MHKIVYRPKFCSLEPEIGQLERIVKQKDSFGKMCAFFEAGFRGLSQRSLRSRLFSYDHNDRWTCFQFHRSWRQHYGLLTLVRGKRVAWQTYPWFVQARGILKTWRYKDKQHQKIENNKNDRRKKLDKNVILRRNFDGKKLPKKTVMYHPRAIRKMLAVFTNNGNKSRQNIGPTHVRPLLI